MANYVKKGEVIDYPNNSGADINYGDIVILGKNIGVAAEHIPQGATGSVKVCGVYEVPAVTTEEFAIGDTLYLDADGKATKTQGELTVVMGWSFAAKASAAAVAWVKID